ncbi:cyclin-domain-containing protein, partial [Sporormia fimetaria CBS 119925]
ESPAVHHSSVRPSPHCDSSASRLPHTGDTPMVDRPAQSRVTSLAAQYGGDDHRDVRMAPKSPRMQPSQHPTPTPARNTPTAQGQQGQRPPVSPANTSPAGSVQTPGTSAAASPRKIKVKSLSHIQSLASDESIRSSSRRQRRDGGDVGPQYEISEMPVTEIIEMVAGLLTKITTTNDRQHEHLHRHIPSAENPIGLSQKTTSVLAFHGKNVPSISILSYLSRIHKYCPTTYEVFISLLVYFDRMTERVNAGPMQSLRQANQQSLDQSQTAGIATESSSAGTENVVSSAPSAAVQAATPPPSGSLGKSANPSSRDTQPPSPPQHIDPPLESDPYGLSQFFVVDSFNIHRLVIAGVTCASKFFSDVFYTNSRYAKVGGLPLVELNHLELQFLLLNDFRLAIPLEEMEAYGTMLVEFYAREVAEQQEK